MGNEKILDKLQKIKSHAESAEKIGNEAEAQAFAAMLQKLLMKHKLSMSDVEVKEMEIEEPVDRHEVDYDKYLDIKVRNAKVRWIITLSNIVAQAHFCRTLTYRKSSRITFIGRKSDCEVVEYLFITMQRLLEKISVKERTRYYNMVKVADGHTLRARGFKAAFIDSFLDRLRQRFEEERQQVVSDDSTALVVLNRADNAAQEWIDAMLKSGAIGHSTKLTTRRQFNDAGMKRGREVANSINLKANAVKSGNISRGQLR